MLRFGHIKQGVWSRNGPRVIIRTKVGKIICVVFWKGLQIFTRNPPSDLPFMLLTGYLLFCLILTLAYAWLQLRYRHAWDQEPVWAY